MTSQKRSGAQPQPSVSASRLAPGFFEAPRPVPSSLEAQLSNIDRELRHVMSAISAHASSTRLNATPNSAPSVQPGIYPLCWRNQASQTILYIKDVLLMEICNLSCTSQITWPLEFSRTHQGHQPCHLRVHAFVFRHFKLFFSDLLVSFSGTFASSAPELGTAHYDYVPRPP